MSTNRIASADACLNFPDLLARVENDGELLAELFSIFKADFPHLLQRLQAAVAKNDAALVASVSHTLKGMLANLAAEKASAAAARLEKTARSGEVAALPAVFFDFEELVTGLLPEIEAYMAEAHS